MLLPLVQYANAANALPNTSLASVTASQMHSVTDELTFANYQQVSIHHIALALNVDFAQQQLSGTRFSNWIGIRPEKCWCSIHVTLRLTVSAC